MPACAETILPDREVVDLCVSEFAGASTAKGPAGILKH
jgi:hypothetical protein